MDYGIRQGRKEIWRRDLGFCAVQEPPKLPLMPSSLSLSLSPPCVCVFSVFLSLLFFPAEVFLRLTARFPRPQLARPRERERERNNLPKE